MNEWISVNDKLPSDTQLKKYYVKIIIGCFSKNVKESVLLGEMRKTGFKFYAGDWQIVTHWREFSED